ncbi:hypothetical protein [Vibrio sp. CK2-1]|uniref:hypothetical protein n=1 Tax=Vibrio sp. CK2-1 TaxID=2912249 RepID=UPI001F3CE5E8|nr:hypothetical protein [Vibrio sp. CK2-1]MCF7355533.1 hypothetical protein [Vibrio sp. CK2-1]
MNTFKLIPLLVAMPLLANANVVLQSDGENLLVNEKPAQLVSQLVDADDNVLDNVKILTNNGAEITALVTLDDKTGLFDIRASGYNQGYAIEALGIYNANCEKVGVTNATFYSLGFIADGVTQVGESSHYQVYQLGSEVSGFDVSSLYELNRDPETGEILPGQDCSQGVAASGYALKLDSGLTSSVNTFFNNLKYPLRIK